MTNTIKYQIKASPKELRTYISELEQQIKSFEMCLIDSIVENGEFDREKIN